MSFPTAKARFEEKFLNSGVSRRSRSITAVFVLLGTSIPTADFPGIGASMRTSAAARLSLISSVNPTIRLTFTPCSGISSYRVTVGPQLTLLTVTLTPKLSSVSSSFRATSRRCASESPMAPRVPFFRRFIGGVLYSGRFSSAFFPIS